MTGSVSLQAWRDSPAEAIFAIEVFGYPPGMGIIHFVGRPLAHFVNFLWLSEGYTQPHAVERLLPTGGLGLVLRLDGRGQVGAVSGARTGPMMLDTSKPLSLIGVDFKPGGAFPFFGMPAGELQDRSVSLELLWGPGAQALHERLMAAPNHEKRFEALERALSARLAPGVATDPAVSYAVRTFQDAGRPCGVGEVVERTGLTARRFIATFRDQVGLAPKVFSRLTRFRRVIDGLGPAQSVDWTSIALQRGYFDQAHFNHDFREFSGISPTEYLRNRTGPNHVRVRD